MYPNRNSLGVTPLHSLGMHPTVTLPQKMRVFATSPDGGAPVLSKPSLPQSIALGGAACVFTVNFTHPIELVKTRMQVTGNGLVHTASSLFRTEGATALWKGIGAAWGRECKSREFFCRLA